MKRAAFAIVLASIAGCGTTGAAYERAALARGAVALSCPRSDVTTMYLGAGGVEVRGCGQRQTYTCVTTANGVVCAPDGAPDGAFVAPSHDGARGTEADRILMVLEPCGFAPGAEIDVFVGAPGDVLRVDAPSDPPGRADCARGRLASERFASRADAERVVVVIPAAPSAEPTASAVEANATGEASARSAIDAAHDAILACNGGAAIAVVGDWAPDGALTVHLPDARAGTPEDGCVRAATSGARLDPAPGVAGSVLHALH